MAAQREQRVAHVRIAQVPGIRARAQHRAAVRLHVDHDLRVVFREEPRIERANAVVREIRRLALAQLQPLREHAGRRGGPRAGGDRVAVSTGLAHVVERRVALPRELGLLGIDAVEIADHRVGATVQAVQIEPVDARARLPRQGRVALAQPADELAHRTIAPHPCGQARQVRERRIGVGIGDRGVALHAAIHAPHIRPVALDRHGVEPAFADPARGDLRAHPVELVGAVRRFAEQHHVGIVRHVD